MECLEDRIVLTATSGLLQLEGPSFAVVGGTGAGNRHPTVIAFRFACGEITTPGDQDPLVRVIAISNGGEVLPITLVTSSGEVYPQLHQGDGAVIGITSPRSLFAQVRGGRDTGFHVYVSLYGDVNGDYVVNATDAALARAGFNGTGQVPAGATSSQAKANYQGVAFLLRQIRRDQGASVKLTTPSLALGTRFVFEPGALGSQDTADGSAGGHWQLYVGGMPFYIQGVTGDYGYADANEWSYDYLNADLASSGANTIRTYGINSIGLITSSEAANTSAALALAAKLSTPSKPFMVLVGLGVDTYTATPAQDLAATEQVVSTIVNDPNASQILGWCVGNEVDNASYYSMINSLAAYIHTLSTAPVMTAVPNVTTSALQAYNTAMPNLDWIGINTFYGQFDATHVQNVFLGQLDQTMATAQQNGDWTKPWAVTEFYSYDLPSPGFGSYAGMPSQVLDGVPYYLELNSTANAANYLASWTNYIVSQKGADNVGGFALNWMPPHNSQVPAYWKDMFVYEGAWQEYVSPYGTGTDRLEAVDAVTTAYGGTPPSSGTPQIIVTDGDPQGIVASFKATETSPGTVVSAGQSLTASITASDALPLEFDWYLIGGQQVLLPPSPAGGITTGPSDYPFTVYGAVPPVPPTPANDVPVTSILVGHGTTSGTTVQNNSITFTMPAVPMGNLYQLRVIIRDGKGGAATAAIGFAT